MRFSLTPLALCISQLAFAHPAADDASSANADGVATEVQVVRVNATVEKDTGFAPTQAQTAGKAPMRLLETPQSISVVTRELMESRQITNLQQALQTVAGVSPVNFGRRGVDDINIRGFRSTESLLIDGLVQSPGMWTRMTPYGYERFEVLKGTASILYGQVQPGGIVNAISKRPKTQTFNEASIEVGSFGLRTLSGDFNRPMSGDGKSAVRVNAQVSEVKDPTDFVYRKDRWAAPSVSFDLGAKTDLVLFATYSQSEWLRQQGVTPYGTLLPNPNGPVSLTRFTGEPGFGAYDIEQITVGYTLEHQFTPDLILRQNVRHETEKGVGNFVANGVLQANRRLQNRTATRQYMDYDLLATDTSLLSRFSALGVRHQLVAGLDARSGTSHLGARSCSLAPLDLYQPVYGAAAACPANLTSDAPSKLTVTGLYAQDQIKFGNGWTALIGARHDRSKNDTDNRRTGQRTIEKDDATTFSGGLVYAITPNWSVYASRGESFLPVGGVTFAGEQFEPETGQQWETGLKYEGFGGRVTGSLALFDLRRQNVTTADPSHPGFSIQAGEQRARGVEFEAGADLRNGWKLTSSYAFTDTEVTRDSNPEILGKPLNLTPRHTVALWASYRVPVFQRVSVGLGARYVSEQKGALPFTLPSYTVADASLTYAGKSFRVTAGVKNLFDRQYYDGAINANVVSPSMPRNYAVNATFFF
ncbi:TonB-dependent siderophore receptor [Massilia sp. KIM]|nr:TonB-dependent siderophore receptor [Massilia sp. KIM]